MQPRKTYTLGAISACLAIFLTAGFSLIPYLGLQNDEVIFGAAIYAPRLTPAYIGIFHRALPTMILSYLGALKAWLYAPILAVWAPSAWSIRVPVLLLGAVTIVFFCRLLDRLGGKRAALVGCALLATDTTYLLTTCFDWGPVVIQRLLAIAAVLLLVKFHQDHSRICLGGAFFLFGLTLWDKALFAWSLIGFSVAVLIVMPGTVRRAIGARNVAVAVICFLAGAYPLIRYNHRQHLGTLRGTVEWNTEGIGNKAIVLSSTLDGSGLFGYLTYDDPTDHPRAPRNGIERASTALDRLAGHPARGFLPYCILAAVIAIPFLWRTPARKPALFALISILVAWGLMAIGRRTGASVHHTALLWPWPHFLVAVTFTELSRRFRRAGSVALIVVIGLVWGQALLVSNAYLSRLARNGGPGSWTDAVYALSERLKADPPGSVVVLDWGMFESLRMLHRGRLPLIWGADTLATTPPSTDDVRVFGELIGEPDRLFISYTSTHEQFAGINSRLRDMLVKIGARREIVAVIHDTNGRPVYELARISRN